MFCQLPADCLNEIFKLLEGDIIALHSCLLVNRSWCEASVGILWRNIWDFKLSEDAWRLYIIKSSTKEFVSSRLLRILSILIACLPNESKDLLYENKIFIPTPTSKPPLFNYVS